MDVSTISARNASTASTTSSTSGSTSSSSSTSDAATAASTMSDNYDMFLEILTVQIKNQNPLSPMDTDKFTDQLTQFSSVEQQIATNGHLETLINSMNTANLSSVVSYIGKDVTVSGDTSVFKDGEATWSTRVNEDASGTFTIKNAAGAIVYTGGIELEEGTNTFTWDGSSIRGGTAPEGEYTISFDMQNASERKVPVATSFTGTVDQIDMSDGSPTLRIGNVHVPISSVLTIKES